MSDCQYTRYDLEKAVPFADEDSIGDWDNIYDAVDGLNAVINVIHREHACCTESDITSAVWLGNSAYEEFCKNEGDVEKTIEYVRAKM